MPGEVCQVCPPRTIDDHQRDGDFHAARQGVPPESQGVHHPVPAMADPSRAATEHFLHRHARIHRHMRYGRFGHYRRQGGVIHPRGVSEGGLEGGGQEQRRQGEGESA